MKFRRKTKGKTLLQKKSRNAIIASLLFVLLLLGACGSGAEHDGPSGREETSEPAQAEEIRIFVATDLHLLAEQLMGDPKKVKALCEESDGKLTEYSPQIVKKFCEQVISERPDALVIAGDLTFNGEIVSLRALAGQLKKVEKAGVPVLLIPGNHDLNNRFASSFDPGEIRSANQISWTDFRLAAERFGYAEGCSRDDSSFSYAYDLGDHLRLIFLDANADQRSGYQEGSLTDGVMQWLAEQLHEAEQSGRQVITVSHQNLLPQNSFLSEGYVLGNHEEVEALLRKYGVHCHLSGHSHLQNTAEKDGLQDICTGVLTGCTLNYGELRVDADGACRYQVRYVQDEDLQKQAVARFQRCARNQVAGLLDQYESFTDAEREQMTELAVRMNTDYFSGSMTLDKILAYQKDPAMKLWMGEVLQDDLWTQYIRSMLH